MHTVKLLTQLVENYQILAYGIIYLGLILEGEFFLIFTGILPTYVEMHKTVDYKKEFPKAHFTVKHSIILFLVVH